MPNIPLQHRVTTQVLKHWQPFRDLKLTFAVSRRAEQLRLRTQQRIIATAPDSALRTEMANLEPLDEEAPKACPLVQVNELDGANPATSQRWVMVC